ncbi:hypothetical protein [Trichormus variabilis]|uniref:hypothetical protein n=1 Tax=Anabaena variabilis TaxID=264691 RepID=UPI00168B6F8B|nr:hypothetical protein [Trichormus variabilis]
MAFYLLILLCICLMTGYFLCKNRHEEIAHLLGIFGSFGVIVILILSPWEILIILLIFIFISKSKDCYVNKFNGIETENQQQAFSGLNVGSQLIYRGVRYFINSNIKLAQIEVQKVPFQCIIEEIPILFI